MSFENLKNGSETIVTIISSLSIILGIFYKLWNFVKYEKLQKIVKALERNRYDRLTENLLRERVEILDFYNCYGVYIEKFKRIKIIKMVKNSNGELDLKRCLKINYYLKFENGKKEIKIKSTALIFAAIDLIFVLILIAMIIILFVIIVLNIFNNNTISNIKLLLYFIVLGISTAILLEKPSNYLYAKKVEKYLKKKK